jgi:hypothetical protein
VDAGEWTLERLCIRTCRLRQFCEISLIYLYYRKGHYFRSFGNRPREGGGKVRRVVGGWKVWWKVVVGGTRMGYGQ